MNSLINDQQIIQKTIFDNDEGYSKEILPRKIIQKYKFIDLFAGSLRTSAKLDYKRLVCLEGYKYGEKGLEKKIGINFSKQCKWILNK